MSNANSPTPADDRTGLLHHVELYVSNLSRSLEFWDWLLRELGYAVFQEWEQGRSYLRGATYLVFVQTEDRFQDPPYHRCRTGLNHLAFHARDREHVEQLTETLRARSVPILYPDQHPYAGGPDYFAVFCEDPDRIKVEIVAPQ